MTSATPASLGWDFDQLSEAELDALAPRPDTVTKVKRKRGRPAKVKEPVKFNTIVEKDMAVQLNRVVETLGISRYDALREAVRDYVEKHSAA